MYCAGSAQLAQDRRTIRIGGETDSGKREIRIGALPSDSQRGRIKLSRNKKC